MADKLISLFFLPCLFFSACSPSQTTYDIQKIRRYDGKHAMTWCRNIVALGPRHPDTPAAEKLRTMIRQHCREQNMVLISDSWQEKTPFGPVRFTNLIANPPPASGKFIVLASHYDTKHIAEAPTFTGANDGASSTALLLDLITLYSQKKITSPYPITFVFFDGEECFQRYTSSDGLYGSRRLCRQWQEAGVVERIHAFILLDMIADADLCLTISPADTPHLRRHLMAVTEHTQLSEHVRTFRTSILDDHTPFLEAGVPAIDFIDFDYGPNNTYWHTEEDTLDKLSVASFSHTGTLLLTFLANLPP